MKLKLQARYAALKSTGLLPSPKGPALAVMQLTRQDNVSSDQLARSIQVDPAMVARVLKLANACRMPGTRPVLTIRDAVSMLGLNALHGLALGFSLMTDKHAVRCRSFKYPDFWSCSLARAVAMHALAVSTRFMQSDEAFSVGLLSHIGELGLASLFPEKYATLLDSPHLSSTERMAQEKQCFEFDHADLTAALMDDWGFPAFFIEPVSYHERSEEARFEAGTRAERMMFALMLASNIADICMAAQSERRAMVGELFLLGGKISIGAAALMNLCDCVVRDWTDWCRLLDMPSQELPPFTELMNAPPAPSFKENERLQNDKTGNDFRVLVVDDDRASRLLLKGLLNKAGYAYCEAENGRQGLELARSERPDLMIVDWLMPEMDGIELIRALRETESGRAIYILLLTGLDQDERLVEAFSAGADDFMSKPLRSSVLTARLIAGQRVVTLHREVKRDQANLQRIATEFANLNQRLQHSYQKAAADHKRMELALRGGNLGMWDMHIPSNTIAFNERSYAIVGYRADELTPDIESWRLLGHPDERAAIDAALQSHLKAETPSYECVYRMRHKEGHWVWILARGQVVEWNEDDTPMRLIGTHMDITERKQIEEKLQLAASVFSHSHEGIMIAATDGTIIDVNEAFSRISGYGRDEVLGRNPRILGSGRQSTEFYSALWHDLIANGYWSGEIWNRRKGGEVYAEMLTISSVRDDQGNTQQYVALFSDITPQKEHEHNLERMAHYDVVTSLPNRVLLVDRLQQGMIQALRRKRHLAVCYLDLDGFKAVNDNFGHGIGDQLLVTLAARMRQALRESDTLARIGGDEFVAVLHDLTDNDSSLPTLNRLLASAAQPVIFGDVTLQVSASLGVTFYPQPDAAEADQLLRQADQAMYQAKVAGKNRIRVFDAEKEHDL